MEPIQVFDEGTQTFLTVYVSKEVVQKCRADNSFAEELYAQIRDQKVEEGSILEIQTELVESSADVIEISVDSDQWSKRETLNFLKLYRMHSSNFPGTPKKKSFWITLSKELAKRKIEKSPEECIEKWKSLMKTYKASSMRTNNFPYFKQVDDIVKNKMDISMDLTEGETSVDEASILTGDVEKGAESKETWSKLETKKFLKIIKRKGAQKHGRTNQFWIDLSEELAKENIFKAPAKCLTKWRNLLRAFKTAQFKGSSKMKFAFYRDVEEIVKEDDFQNIEFKHSEEEDESLDSEYGLNATGDSDNATKVDEKHHTKWSEYETFKLIDLYKKHRHKYSKFLIKNEFWNMLAEELKKEGYKDKDGTRCRSKLRNLIVSCTNSDGNKFKYAKAMEDILKGEESERDEGDPKDGKTKWSQTETAALLSAYRDNVAGSPDSCPDWSGISDRLLSADTKKSADDCKQRWEHLLSIYRTHKDLNVGSKTRFVHFEAIDEILGRESESTEAEEEGAGCLCRRDLRLDKEKRHRERMELMQRKLDIEERKVAAFEEYLKMIKREKD